MFGVGSGEVSLQLGLAKQDQDKFKVGELESY
jgi:hypothetical protein